MRVHGNQVDSNFELNALYAAAKTEAKLEAERVRRKLMAAALAGDDDAADCVVSLSGEGAPGKDASQQDAQSEGEAKKEQRGEGGDGPFSGWA
ncbi:MAG: hypothetical protein ABR910_05180 [Acidobacteriaceae bacterium]|jgi:DNA invertase Pin-like site-specific DNA recombinase